MKNYNIKNEETAIIKFRGELGSVLKEIKEML